MGYASAVVGALEDGHTCLLRFCEGGQCHSEHAFSDESEGATAAEDALGSGVSQQ